MTSVEQQQKQLRDLIIKTLIDREGGFVNNSKDNGGPTRWGITEKLARANGYTGPMHLLEYDLARSIYESEFWHGINGDNLVMADFQLAGDVMDFAVLSGQVRAGATLQRALNLFNKNGTLYDDVNVDGMVGPKTLKALNSYLKNREASVLRRAYKIIKGAYFITLAERRKSDEEFIFGWIKNRIVL